MNLRDAIREMVAYLQERYRDEHSWGVWRDDYEAFESTVRDQANRLWKHQDVLFAATPRLARALTIIKGETGHGREAWDEECRAVWASL